MADGSEPTINYTVKEVLGRLELKLDQLVQLISLKADHADVMQLRTELDEVKGRLSEVEHYRKESEHISTWRQEWRRWLVPTLLTVIVTAATIVQAFH